MSRKAKQGLAYYNVDTDRYLDLRIKQLRHCFSCVGIAVYDYILCEIYRDKGCFIEWGESTAFEVADYFNIKESTVSEVVAYCCNVGLFNKELRANESVLTSYSIQDRYLKICIQAKRKTIIIPEEIALIQEEMAKTPELTRKTPEEVHKVKKSKVKKSNSKSHCGVSPPPVVKKEEKIEEESQSHWQILVEAWFVFNQKKFGDRPSFLGADPRHLKKILSSLKKRAEEKKIVWTAQVAVSRLNCFLEKAFEDKWMRENFLLQNLEKFMDKFILNQQKNANSQTNYAKVSQHIDFSGGI